MITLGFWGIAGLLGLSAAAGCLFGMICMWHPGRPGSDVVDQPAPMPRTAGPRHAGYLDPGPNTGCYQPRREWPEPDWPDSTFSEISAGWDRLERSVIAETQPFGKVRP